MSATIATATPAQGPHVGDVLHALAHQIAEAPARPKTTIRIADGRLEVETTLEAMPVLLAAFSACGMSTPADAVAAFGQGADVVVVPFESHGLIDDRPCKIWAPHQLTIAQYRELCAAKKAAQVVAP